MTGKERDRAYTLPCRHWWFRWWGSKHLTCICHLGEMLLDGACEGPEKPSGEGDILVRCLRLLGFARIVNHALIVEEDLARELASLVMLDILQ